MKREEKITTYNKKRNIKFAAKLGQVLMLLTVIVMTSQSINARVVDCSSMLCDSTDQQTINGEKMFNENNFVAIVDDLGRTRKFWIHIPESYDTLPKHQKMPVIFSFHGKNQYREAMVAGKWDEHFDQDTAFVIPLGTKAPCDTTDELERIWINPLWGPGVPTGTALPATCDPATQKKNIFRQPITYFNASLTDTFTDVNFIEELRAMILSRFLKLSPKKVYAAGFSNGGSFTYTLLCYRSSLFKGFSVSASSLFTVLKRGDYDGDIFVETDPNSLLATCGKSNTESGHATGISSPDNWGLESIMIQAIPPIFESVRNTKPIVIFHGDQDDGFSQAEIDDTVEEIKTRNNLDTFPIIAPFYLNFEPDGAATTRRTFKFPADSSLAHSAFRNYSVMNTNSNYPSAGHAMPDAEECPVFGGNNTKMTCDYSYTTETMNFFINHADLNLSQ